MTELLVGLLVGLFILAVMVVVAMNSTTRDDAQREQARRLAVIERRLQVVFDHLGLSDEQDGQPDYTEVVAHLEAGRRAAAIKEYRSATGADAVGAEQAVEEIARQHGL